MKLFKRIGAMVLASAMALTIVTSGGSALAAESDGKTDLTIHKYEVEDLDDYDLPHDGTEIDSSHSSYPIISSLAPLNGISFRVQAAELKSTATAGSTDPADYEAVASGYDETIVTGSGTNNSGEALFAGLEKGIYLVTELDNAAVAKASAPFVVQLPLTNPDGDGLLYDVHVYPKNELENPPEIEKDTEDVSAGIGQTVTWDITVDIPKDIATAQVFKISDQIDTRLDFTPNSTNVRAYYLDKDDNPVPLTYGTDFDVDYTNRKLVIDFYDGRAELANGLIDVANPKLYIEIDTVVNETAVDDQLGEVPNEASLDYTNNLGKEYEPKTDESKVDVLGIKIVKTKEDGSSPLGGAKFQIYNVDPSTPGATPMIDPINGGVWEVTTDNTTGLAYFDGLAYGSYWLVETQAPAGYNLLTDPIKVDVVEGQVGQATAWRAETEVINRKGFVLPITGGSGTVLFTLAGIVLVMVGVGVYSASKKSRKAA